MSDTGGSGWGQGGEGQGGGAQGGQGGQGQSGQGQSGQGGQGQSGWGQSGQGGQPTPGPGGLGGPAPGYVPAPGVYTQPPPNYLVWSILSTIFCCLPAGIVSIVFAAQVNSKHAAGDAAGAQQASKNAKVWAIVAAAVGLVLVVGWIALGLMGLAFSGGAE